MYKSKLLNYELVLHSKIMFYGKYKIHGESAYNYS